MHDPDLRAELSRGALAQAASFAWERTADRDRGGLPGRARSMRDDLAAGASRDPARGRPRHGRAATLGESDLSLVGDPRGRVHRRAARREEAADPVPARRRRARARRARLRVPPPRREPRAGLPLAARAQPEDVRRRRSRSTRSATSTSTRRLPLVAVTPDEIDRLLGAVLTLRRRVVQHDPRARLRHLDPQGVGVAAQPRASRRATSRRSAAGSSGTDQASAVRGGPGRAAGAGPAPTPTRQSAPPTYAIAGGASARNTTAEQRW